MLFPCRCIIVCLSVVAPLLFHRHVRCSSVVPSSCPLFLCRSIVMSVVPLSFHRHVYVRVSSVVPSSCICPCFLCRSIVMYMSVFPLSFHRHVYVRCFCVVPSSCICHLFLCHSIVMYMSIVMCMSVVSLLFHRRENMYMFVVSVSFHPHVYVSCFSVVPSSRISSHVRVFSLVPSSCNCVPSSCNCVHCLFVVSSSYPLGPFRSIVLHLHVAPLSFVSAVASSPSPTTHRRHVRPWPRSSLLIQQCAFYIAALSYSSAPHGHNSARPSVSVVWLISSPSIISRSAVR